MEHTGRLIRLPSDLPYMTAAAVSINESLCGEKSSAHSFIFCLLVETKRVQRPYHSGYTGKVASGISFRALSCIYQWQ